MEAFFVVGKRNAFAFYFALNFLILCRFAASRHAAPPALMAFASVVETQHAFVTFAFSDQCQITSEGHAELICRLIKSTKDLIVTKS
jgi:hypothetical protein